MGRMGRDQLPGQDSNLEGRDANPLFRKALGIVLRQLAAELDG
jgi:hypothetical protein